MSLLLDLILVAILVVCAYRGYKQGIIIGVISIAGIIACICAGNIMASAYTEEFTAVPRSVGAGLVDSMVNRVLDADAEVVTEDDENLVVRLTEAEKQDVRSVCFAVCRQLGFSEDVANEISEETAGYTAGVNQSMSATLCEVICTRVTRLLIFAIVFLLTVILLAAVKNTLDLFLSLPGIETVNRLVGAILGGFKGLIYLLLLCTALRYMGMLIPNDAVDKAILARAIMNNNLIANALGL